MEATFSEILGALILSIDWLYALMCNFATYMVINIVEGFGKNISKGLKRLISALVAIVLGVVMVTLLNRPFEPVFYAFFVQFLIYDYFLKSILESLKKRVNPKE